MNSLVAGVASNYLLFSPAITIVQVPAGWRIRLILENQTDRPTIPQYPWHVWTLKKGANVSDALIPRSCLLIHRAC
jgi:hypothetical protein